MRADRQPAHRLRECEREAEHDPDADRHQQEIAQSHFARVLLLRAHQVAQRGKLHSRARATAQEMQQQRHRRGGGEEKPPGREKTHGARCRLAKARRTGTPKGAFVGTGS